MTSFKQLAFAVIIALLGIPKTLQASSPEECAAIDDDKDRLVCFDLLFRKSVTSTESSGNWQVRLEESKIDDSTNAYISLQAVEPYSNRYGDKGFIELWFACRENETNVYIYFAGEHMTDIQGYGDVTYRIDKQKAITREFLASTNNKSLGLWSGSQAIPFIKSLYDANSLYVRATPFSESSIQAEFDVTGARDATTELRKACSWK